MDEERIPLYVPVELESIASWQDLQHPSEPCRCHLEACNVMSYNYLAPFGQHKIGPLEQV